MLYNWLNSTTTRPPQPLFRLLSWVLLLAPLALALPGCTTSGWVLQAIAEDTPFSYQGQEFQADVVSRISLGSVEAGAFRSIVVNDTRFDLHCRQDPPVEGQEVVLRIEPTRVSLVDTAFRSAFDLSCACGWPLQVYSTQDPFFYQSPGGQVDRTGNYPPNTVAYDLDTLRPGQQVRITIQDRNYTLRCLASPPAANLPVRAQVEAGRLRLVYPESDSAAAKAAFELLGD